MSVFWIVDRALGRSEGGYEALVEQLGRQGKDYALVRKPPMADYLVGMPQSDDPEEIRRANDTPVEITAPNPVFITGTTSMKLVAARQGWSPGYVDAPGQDELIQHWGDEVLNVGAKVTRLRDAEPPSERFFARPVEDSKSFSGKVFDHVEWTEFRDNVVNLQAAFTTLTGDDLVMLAPLRNIYAEYRLYVIGGEIATGSRYKLGPRVFSSTDLDPKMLDYARERIAEWCPRRALCLDIAQIEGPTTSACYKVIETNAISSAGFYACDMGKFVSAIEDEYGHE